MTDLTWLSQEAKTIHDIFQGMFFSLATLMLLCGVLIEYFRLPLTGAANFSSLVGRCLVATIILVAYPEVTNWIAQIGDDLAIKIGGLSNLDIIIDKTKLVLKEKSFSWSNIGDTLLWVVSYLVYGVLYVTVFVFDAIILYGWTILYIFSPILILMYILPQTASATGLLFRCHIELASYKVIWSTLGTLLWSSALKNLASNDPNGPNFFVVMAFMLLVAFSIIFTPKMVSALTTTGVSGLATGYGAIAASALSAGMLSGSGLSKVASAPARMMKQTGAKITQFAQNRARSSPPKPKPYKPPNSSRVGRTIYSGPPNLSLIKNPKEPTEE